MDYSPLELEILRRTAHLGSLSYDATPMYGADDSSATDAGHDDSLPPSRDEIAPEAAAAPEAAEAPDDGTQRLGNTDW